MALPFLRRPYFVALVAAAALAGGCSRKPEGVIHVDVIDGTPRLVEPSRGPLSPSERVLVENAAQGLVRFDARGQIEPGLAETWNVSDDGLSYIFRIANEKWPNGGKITAEEVARMLRRLISRSSRDPLKDSFGAVDDIVAMTDRVIEIRLNQPRPHLLQLLAQPEMGLVREGRGSGPFSIEESKAGEPLRLMREVETFDDERSQQEQLDLSGTDSRTAVKAFVAGTADLVLGGTFADLPLVPRGAISRRSLQFDPAGGLFGLAPASKTGIVADPEVRQLLSEAIDRDSFVAALSVPGLVSRATVLEPGLDNIPDPVAPGWASSTRADRQEQLAATASQLFDKGKSPLVRVALPDGPGADILFDRLSKDWGAIGITVSRTGLGEPADLKLVDQVAPSSSASWYLRRFTCSAAKLCDSGVDDLLDSARDTGILAQRSGLLAQAAREIDSKQLFIPIAAPIRWSLVSARVVGFSGNRFAIHTLTGLEQQLNRTGD